MYEKIVIIGNLGGDPEMRYMGDGTAVTNFSVATNRSWTDKASGEARKETTWFRVSVWGRQAEVANQYLARGRKVLVEGRMNPDPQTGGPRVFIRQDGSAGSSYEIKATDIRFLGGRDEGGGDGDRGGQIEEDDIPF